jgi:hypothetical protein
MAENDTLSHGSSVTPATVPATADPRAHSRLRRLTTRLSGLAGLLLLVAAGVTYYVVFSDRAGWWAPDEPVVAGDHTTFTLFTLGVTAGALLGAALCVLCAVTSRTPAAKLLWVTLAAVTVLLLLRSNLEIGTALRNVFPERTSSA